MLKKSVNWHLFIPSNNIPMKHHTFHKRPGTEYRSSFGGKKKKGNSKSLNPQIEKLSYALKQIMGEKIIHDLSVRSLQGINQ